MNTINREHIEKAILEINEGGIPSNAHSSTYDVVVDGKRYPPKLLIELASKHSPGATLARRDFHGGRDENSFKVIKECGYTIKNKSDVDIKELLTLFLNDVKRETLKTFLYPKKYNDYSLKVSFGQGTLAIRPWIAIIKKGQKTRNGIYPVYLYYKALKKLILTYGISEDNKPDFEWDIPNLQTIGALFGDVNAANQQSFVHSAYDIEDFKLPDGHDYEKDLDNILYKYENNIKPIASSVDRTQTNSKTTSSVMLNTILYGPPGTGKTYNTVSIAKEILGAASLDEITSIGRLKKEFPNRIDFVTFHQSFAYDDFVEGLRASTTNTGSLTYKVEEGIFKRICQNVELGKPSVLIIDEINRGNISKIFGELITLIEDTKRQGEDEELVVTLPYSKESFSVPKELHIIGTMNTADRSLVMIDTALRRRFNFIEMMPEPELLENIEGIDCPKLLQTINERIEQVLDKEHAIGHSFFIKCKTAEDVINVFKNNLLPLLEEYFFDDFDKIQPILGNHFYEQVEFDSSWTNDEITINENIIRRRKDIFNSKSLFIKAVKSIYP